MPAHSLPSKVLRRSSKPRGSSGAHADPTARQRSVSDRRVLPVIPSANLATSSHKVPVGPACKSSGSDVFEWIVYRRDISTGTPFASSPGASHSSSSICLLRPLTPAEPLNRGTWSVVQHGCTSNAWLYRSSIAARLVPGLQDCPKKRLSQWDQTHRPLPKILLFSGALAPTDTQSSPCR